jgi:DNA-binding response OmpR family regulator
MSVPTEARQVRIALVDDDSGLVTVMARRFEALRWDYEVLSYAPGPDQLAALRINALVLNPALSGLDYIERLGTALPGLAVLAISGPTQVADRVRALRSGADDWITKPCHPEELIARIQAVMRRRRLGEALLDDEPTVAGELTIRPDQFDAYVDCEAAGLSRKEYELLRQLAAAEGRVLERELIYQRVWGYTMVRGDRSVDVFVRKLRNKLERISPNWRYVHTHFGVGYRFAAERLEPGAGDSPDPEAASGEIPGSLTPPDLGTNPTVRLDLTAFR